MSVVFRANETEWVVGATWITERKQPSVASLRQRAKAYKATHYAVVKSASYALGFFDLDAVLAEDNGKKQTLRRGNPLAPVMAKALGADIFAQISLPDGSIWIVATDHASDILSGTDRIISPNDLDALIERFEMGRFHECRTIDGDGFDKILATLNPETVRFREVSLQTQWQQAVIATAAILVVYGGYQLWTAHLNRIAAEQARREAEQLQKDIAKSAALNAPTPPSEWIEGCMAMVLHQPVFYKGWIQTSWQCSGKTLTFNWIRAGGTLANAPNGTMSANGNNITQMLPVEFHRANNRRFPRGDGTKQLVSWLQSLGIQPKITMAQIPGGPGSVPGGPPSNQPAIISTNVTWVFPTDPRSPFWDDVPSLTMQTLAHETGLALQGGFVDTGQGYQMAASIAVPSIGVRPQ